MSVKFAAWGNAQFVIPSTGAPASGYRLYTYVANSSTPVTTYTTAVGDVQQSNPIVLNSAGFPTTGQIWITEGTSIKIIFTDASDVPIKTEDNIPGTNDSSLAQDQWVASGLTPTFVSSTSFTFVGDQTQTFHAGRRLKTINSGGTVYSTIVTSVFGVVTTITVLNDFPGVLDSGLSAVSYGLLSASNPSTPFGTGIGTTVASTSGTSIDFTGIPGASFSKITLTFVGVSTNGTDNWLIQLGDSGGIETAGYLGAGTAVTNAGATSGVNHTAGFGIVSGAAANLLYGSVTITLANSATSTFVCSGVLGASNAATTYQVTGFKTLSATLDRVRITTVAGVDTFDAGTIGIVYQ